MVSDARSDSAPLAAVCDVLLASLEALAQAGQADAACRLAGRSCAALRGQDAGQWRRFNAFLHRRSGAADAAAEPALLRGS
jgi:hypothetical protein